MLETLILQKKIHIKINTNHTMNHSSMRNVAIKIANITFLFGTLSFAFIGVLSTYKTFQPLQFLII